MSDRERILQELERRIKLREEPQQTAQLFGQLVALEDFRDWIKALPQHEPSELVKRAREKAKEHRANGWDGDAEDLDRLADALEASEARLHVARSALMSIVDDHDQFARERARTALKEMG
jgi:hypothetical protein